MKGYSAFLRKELLEQKRTYKLLVMLIVFTLFGMMSPLLAKFIPDILASVGAEGMTITVPEPTYMDAYAQFFKNATQMGIVVLLLVFAGSMSQELSRGTLVNVLAKGLPRTAVMLSKYTACLALWTVSLALCAAVHYGYTLYLFGSHPTTHLLLSLLCLWLFGAFLLAVIMLTGTMLKGGYSGLLATAAVLGILLLLSMLPGSAHWNPVTLVSISTGLLDGSIQTADVMGAFWISAGATVLGLAGAVLVFRKRQL
jgi:ABC-2 type transport system permease protein